MGLSSTLTQRGCSAGCGSGSRASHKAAGRADRASFVDLLDIALYVAMRSLEAADRLIDGLHDKMARVAEQPGLGRRRDELAHGSRSVTAGRYVIFCRPCAEGVVVIRVLHGARDIPAEFEG